MKITLTYLTVFVDRNPTMFSGDGLKLNSNVTSLCTAQKAGVVEKWENRAITPGPLNYHN